MMIIPAIDLKDGKVVRLWQGRFDKVTVYSDDPAGMARQWVSLGAQWLHVVDLDGAQGGEIKNIESIRKIVEAVNIPVEMGGGIREREDIERLLTLGVSRVILGTKAVEDRKFLKETLSRWKERIAISLDCSNGIATQRGWTSVSQLKATDFARELQGMGLSCLIYTDIARDGTLTGPNFEGLTAILASVNIPVIASGGVASLEDVRKLCLLEPQGLKGAIVGKAIYEGQLDLKEAIELCLKSNIKSQESKAQTKDWAV